MYIYNKDGFSSGSDGKRICLQRRRLEFSPWFGKIPWRREWLPTPVFLPGESHGQRNLAGCSPWGQKRIEHGWATNNKNTHSFFKQSYWNIIHIPYNSPILEKTLNSPLNCKEIQPVHPKGNQSWIFIGRTDVEAETPILWPPDAKNWLIGKDPHSGKDQRQEEKGTSEDKMTG